MEFIYSIYLNHPRGLRCLIRALQLSQYKRLLQTVDSFLILLLFEVLLKKSPSLSLIFFMVCMLPWVFPRLTQSFILQINFSLCLLTPFRLENPPPWPDFSSAIFAVRPPDCCDKTQPKPFIFIHRPHCFQPSFHHLLALQEQRNVLTLPEFSVLATARQRNGCRPYL